MPHITNIYLSSANAHNLSLNNSRMIVNLSNPINLVAEVKKTYCKVLQTTLWYDHPNVISGVNNAMTFTLNGTVYNFTFGQGLYSIDDIQERLTEFGINATPPLPTGTFKIVPDEATGKVSLSVKYTSITWNFDVGNTLFKLLLGFDGFFTADSEEWEESDNVASLNNLSSYMFHVSFCNGGYMNGDSGMSIVSNVLIPPAQRVGTQIIDVQNNPPVSIVNQLLIDRFVVWITKEDGVTPIITNETWTMLINLYTE